LIQHWSPEHDKFHFTGRFSSFLAFMAAPAPTIATVYVNRLDEKVPLSELRPALLSLLSPFGRVLRIEAATTLRKRGQAFVVLDSKQGAEAAVAQLSGFHFFGRPLCIALSNAPSVQLLGVKAAAHIQ
jgi:hypothetical protein